MASGGGNAHRGAVARGSNRALLTRSRDATAVSTPRTNLQGLKEHWRSDLVAGSSVALVALPLALGIATAAGAPPISGLVSAIVAGLFATFIRGSNVAINGPGNSLIVIVAAGFTAFGGGPEAFPHVLGAVVVSGGLQMLFGALRLGKLGDLIPASVVQGMLAAIGLIIVGKQAHVLFGETASASNPIDVFRELPQSVAHLHPAATVIGVVSLVVVIVHPKIKTTLIHSIPAPLWVVIFTVPMVLGLTYFDEQVIASMGQSYHLTPDMLVSIPDDLLASLVFPDFSRIGDPSFWMVVVTLTLVTSIENIVSVKAVDKLDSHRRRSKLDRDLVAMGLSTIVSGFAGGLPVLTVVARSSVNVNHGATTGWSNFFHGLILLAVLVLLGPFIEVLALSALAGILVYTGYKLTAPHVIEDTLRKGPDHFIVFGITVVATLYAGLLWGITIGIWAELTSHFLILGMRPREAYHVVRGTHFETKHDEDEAHVVRVIGVANFLQILRLRRTLDEIPRGQRLIIDFNPAILVDNALLEYTHDFGRRYAREPRASFEVVGLEAHRAIADHPDALHAQERHKHERRLTPRQKTIAENAENRGWSFEARREWSPPLEDFHFFRVHLVEFRDTVVRGSYSIDGRDVEFTLSDVTFDEGALIPEIYHTTAQVIDLPVETPEFMLEKEALLAHVLARVQDIDFNLQHFKGVSPKFAINGADENAIREFMTPELLEFFEREEIYHLESTGERLVVFKAFMRRATPDEIEDMLGFSERLIRLLAA